MLYVFELWVASSNPAIEQTCYYNVLPFHNNIVSAAVVGAIKSELVTLLYISRLFLFLRTPITL